jgi:hypothetical protein
MQLQQAVNSVFRQLSGSLQELSHTLNGNTIGQHVRHIVELFQCLETGYGTGIVNYEKRKRDPMIENNKKLAQELLSDIYSNLNKSNKELELEAIYDEMETEPVFISTNYFREVAYNLEHTIHHMALIRVGVSEVSRLILPDNFGIATSTLKHRKQCAQ